ncbi:MAG TPA: SDR family oxidoreductase [Steroidobacteraceae bacterium]|nr:SDR family oxidoreductase [Steroidobacteraceae bacterium]
MAVSYDLGDQAILITGAGRGLGKSMAETLAGCGATVGLIDVDGESCGAAAAAIIKSGGKAHAYVADVSNRMAFANAAAKFAGERGRIDAVINNAMLLRYEPIEKVTDEVLDRMLAIGIKGSVWGAQLLLAHMDAARGGAIVNLASPVAERGFPNTAVYSLVKGAIVTLTKTLAAELGPRKVRVNAVAPGSVPTPGAMGLNDRAEYERRARTIPLRRLGREEDNAAAVAFLLSRDASFINGEILHVDGGIAAAQG